MARFELQIGFLLIELLFVIGIISISPAHTDVRLCRDLKERKILVEQSIVDAV